MPATENLPESNLPIHVRTFLTNDTVHKVFDTDNDRFSPNNELMRECGIKEVQKNSLSTDGRFVEIVYPYIVGDHTIPDTLRAFAGVTEMLHKIHGNNYVHGDIRKENIDTRMQRRSAL